MSALLSNHRLSCDVSEKIRYSTMPEASIPRKIANGTVLQSHLFTASASITCVYGALVTWNRALIRQWCKAHQVFVSMMFRPPCSRRLCESIRYLVLYRLDKPAATVRSNLKHAIDLLELQHWVQYPKLDAGQQQIRCHSILRRSSRDSPNFPGQPHFSLMTR